MTPRELIREVALLLTSAEIVELGARLGNPTGGKAMQAKVERLLRAGADPDDLAAIVDAGRRSGALLATVDIELPPKRDPAAELKAIAEDMIRREMEGMADGR